MNVPDEVRKCVAFLQYRSGASLTLAGTVFFVGVEEEGCGFTYAVTARHVVDTIRSKGKDGLTHFRLNRVDGGVEVFGAPTGKWVFHPTDETTDLAVMEFPDENHYDMRVIPADKMMATEDVIKAQGIGIGDELFLVGLFYRHFGAERNIPIVRCGNIAAMPEEPVNIGEGLLMDAYLVEMRSIGGLSGSPVFTYLLPYGGDRTFFRTGSVFLLGLMHGHWGLEKNLFDELTPDEPEAQPLNTGIGVVVPAEKILEAINQERLAERRAETIREVKARGATTPDRPPAG